MIDRLGAEIAKLEVFMADPDLFHKEPLKFKKATEAWLSVKTRWPLPKTNGLGRRNGRAVLTAGPDCSA